MEENSQEDGFLERVRNYQERLRQLTVDNDFTVTTSRDQLGYAFDLQLLITEILADVPRHTYVTLGSGNQPIKEKIKEYLDQAEAHARAATRSARSLEEINSELSIASSLSLVALLRLKPRPNVA